MSRVMPDRATCTCKLWSRQFLPTVDGGQWRWVKSNSNLLPLANAYCHDCDTRLDDDGSVHRMAEIIGHEDA